MFARDSRYHKASPFRFAAGEPVVFAGVRPRPIEPATGVVEHVLRSWERLDQLAQYYYNDPRKWWRILDANPDLLYAGELAGEEQAGRIILIPRAEEGG